MRSALAVCLLALTTPSLAIEHATFGVDEFGVATKTHGTPGFTLGTGSVTGEYAIQIGADASDDAMGGVLFSSVAERGRIDANRVGGTQLQFSVGGAVADSDPNSINTRGLSGGLAVTTTRIGAAGIPGDPPTAAPNGGEPFGASFGSAYFSYNEGWTAGTFSSSTINTNGTFGALDTYSGSTGVRLDEDFYGDGQHRLRVPGVTDPFSQGMVYVNTASNVGRYATAQPHPDGTGYWISTPDNDGYFEFDPASDPDLVNEADSVTTPFSFVFIPQGQTGLTAAYLNPTYSPSLGVVEAYPYFSTGGDFRLTPVDRTNAPGSYRLTVNGGSPSQGTLLLNNGIESIAGDNALTYEADGDGWLITSEDIESNLLTGDTTDLNELDGLGQNHNGGRGYFSFVYVPNDGAATAAAPVPSLDSVTHLDRRSVFAWNGEVEAANNNNDPGDVVVNITAQTPGANAVGVGANRGDYNYAAFGRGINGADGIMFSTVSEGFRDNTGVGGQQEYGVATTTLFSGYWAAVTHAAWNVSGTDEHNIDHAVAFFGAESGFQMATNQAIPGDFGAPYAEAKVDIDLAGVDALSDGVLIAAPYGNDDNFASAAPKEDGSGWEVRVFDNTYDSSEPDGRTEPDAINWVYLPYETENLVAGLVDSDGTLLSSSDGVGTEWTLTRELDSFDFPQYRLSITGKTAADGMLLLVATGDADSSGTENIDNSMLYEIDGDDFLIRGIDHIPDGSTEFVDYQDTGFMFAFIDYANAPIAPLRGDFNGDGLVDAADFTVWRDNEGLTEGATRLMGDGDGDGDVDAFDYAVWRNDYGRSAPGALTAAVPEPTALLLAAAGVAAAATRRRDG